MSLSEAMEGNQNGVKLKDSDVRQQAYKQYCEHLAQGYSKKSFCFRHPELNVSYKTLDKYINDNPAEFPPIHIEFAIIDGFKLWEGVVMDSAKGINKEANTASLQMLMRNKYGWDKKEDDAHEESFEDKKSTFVRRVFSSLGLSEKEVEKHINRSD